jgi:hypothetical protein
LAAVLTGCSRRPVLFKTAAAWTTSHVGAVWRGRRPEELAEGLREALDERATLLGEEAVAHLKQRADWIVQVEFVVDGERVRPAQGRVAETVAKTTP